MRHLSNELLTPPEVSELLGVAPTVLREMRKTRSGIAFVAYSPRAEARYRYHDVVRWFFDVAQRLKVEDEARQTAFEREQRVAARQHLTLVRRRRTSRATR
jgi:hypothetical protein